MNFRRIILFFVFVNCFSTSLFAQYIQVNDTYTAQQLVEDVLINSTCANVSNFTSSGDTFSQGEQSFGYFNSGTSNFHFKDGIVLSTSRAKRAEGPNDNLIDEGSTSWSGDQDLENALNITNTINATILEFDFIPQTSSFSFDYIFASEEYQGTAPCKYSDGFAFLLKEANTTDAYQNLAVIPNTTTPVLVTNVHPDINGSCPAINENYFGGYNNTNAPINYNGQTVVLTAKSTVIAGKKYHIKLVIADHSNIRYDSAIFLSGGSFNVGTDLGPDQLFTTQNPVCEGQTHLLDATESGTNAYVWFKNDILIPGESQPTYTVKDEGNYKVEISLGNTNCISKGEVNIEYSKTPILNPTTLVQCDEDTDGKTFFNLTKADVIITNNDQALKDAIYYENLLDAQNQDISKSIVNKTKYESTAKQIYASVSNDFGCANETTVTLQISNNKMVDFVDYEKCDDDATKDGFYKFTLSEIDPLVLAGLPVGLIVEYYETLDNAILQLNILPNNYINKTIYIMTIYARIVNGSDCYGIIPVRLFANSNTPPNFEDETISFCQNGSKRLEIASTFSSYLWSNGDTNYYTYVDKPGSYSVTVSDNNTCLATKNFTVVATEIPKIISVDVNDFQDNNTVLINYTGIGENEFSLDGKKFQESPYFTNVIEGEYTVWIKNNCGIDSKKIYVLNYPKFFTPNGDSYNDTWEIKNIEKLADSKIQIYDRHGKLIYQFNKNKKGWDGKFNGLDLPSSDYWFVITTKNNQAIKGHFTLKR